MDFAGRAEAEGPGWPGPVGESDRDVSGPGGAEAAAPALLKLAER